MIISHSKLIFGAAPALLVAFLLVQTSHSQEGAKDEPIYLKEVRQPPPVKAVRSRTIEKTYEDEKTVRVKFGIVQLSDDSFVNDGPFVEYYKNGQKYQEGTYKRGIYVGDWSYWHPNGQVCRKMTFEDGKLNGQWEVFRADGTRREVQSYADGVRDGTWKSFHLDGETALVEFTYKKGEVTGERLTYHLNGKKRQSVFFKNGKMHGPTTEWDDTGKKVLEATFENGKRVGDVVRY